MKLEPHDVIIQWAIRWAALMISRYSVGADGRTAYERRRGRRCRAPVIRFGETIWFKELKPHAAKRDKFNSDWNKGVWMGQARESQESIIGTGDGVVRAYAVN